MRILHFSDIHLRQPWRRVPWKDWPVKRLIGGVNLLLGRSRAFADAERKLAALVKFQTEQQFDLVIFTGDYTAMGTSAEFRAARAAVTPLLAAPLGYLNVPGNHDIYVRDVLREGRFQKSFGDTLTTDLPQYSADEGPWPFVKLISDRVAIVGVNSARPNPQPWRSSGRIPSSQLQALKAILEDSRVRSRFVFVITHYAPCLEHGRADSWSHGLVNAADFLNICRKIQHGAILCGHVHRRFLARLDDLKVPVLCAGSATMAGRESLWVYELEQKSARATPGRWEDDQYALDTTAAVELVRDRAQ